MNDKPIEKEDYEEPRCPFCTDSEVKPLPLGRIIEKLDEYLFNKDYVMAEKHLTYWICEGDETRDYRGKLAVVNEMVGLQRKLGNKEKCLKYCEEALKLLDELNFGESITQGTTYINVATAYKVFEQTEKGLELYEKAKLSYEKLLKPTDDRLGGLYNNYALACMDVEDFDKAEELFNKALSVMKIDESNGAEVGITYCNLANLYEAKFGENSEKIKECIENAYTWFTKKAIRRNGEYAYAIEKSVPTFKYYGYDKFAEELNEISRRIYERD